MFFLMGQIFVQMAHSVFILSQNIFRYLKHDIDESFFSFIRVGLLDLIE